MYIGIFYTLLASSIAKFPKPGEDSFHALLWRKSAELAEAFIESDNLLNLLDNQKMFCFDHALNYISDLL